MNSSPFMDKQIMGLSASGSADIGGELFDLMNPQEEHGNGGGGVLKKEEILPSYDFQPIRTVGSSSSMGNNNASSGLDGVGRHSWGSGDSKIGPSNLRYSNISEPHELPKVNHEKGRETYDGATVSEIDRIVKKYADNLFHALEAVSSRLSQLESRTHNLENSVDELKVTIGNNTGSTDGKLRQLENVLREVQTGVQFLRDKQEIAEAQLQLTKLQQSSLKAENYQPLSEPSSVSAPPQQPPPPPPPQQHSAPPPPQHSAPPPPPQYQPLPPSLTPPQQPPLLPAPNAPPPPTQQNPPPQYPSQLPANQTSYYSPPRAQPPQSQQPQPPPQPQHYQLAQYPQSMPPPQPSMPHQSEEPAPYIQPPLSHTYPPGIRQPAPLTQPPPTSAPPQYYGPSSGQLSLPPGYGPPSGPSFSEPYPYSGSPSHYSSAMKPSPFLNSPPASGGGGGGGGGGYSRLPTAKILPQAAQSGPSSGAGGGNRVPIDDVVDKVATMGFSRDQVRATVRKLTENGQSVDLNVVLDKLMNDGAEMVQPQKGWFGR